MTEQEQLDKAVLEYRLHWVTEALRSVAVELARAAVSEYTPQPKEMLEMAKWAWNADEEFKQEAANIIKQAQSE